ncbi:malate dehydrogenase, NAD-dependent [Sulfurimonas gotlandica GD1]|uniref:Malate dehydrogenase n=1 Tax=Sulfurimonas gotlandica (strain DSM 19862 / JCM 16533 / GD1) TaxID=929558 RepID=B6BK78_SULGG|nr:malate dehydrogenase [Sulfurimonas gotlandica]EDZ62716.1 malate dehydrogenase [Sulfurimonas gotlandica GD1]EHP31172.1 malate dehydrogenase, NAD-dependent [Sulfurimonas gotlandica GD1]
MRGKRVGIVGVGNVGSSVAYSLAMSGSCHEVILRAHDVDKARGKALDLSQAAQAARKHTVITVAETLEDVKDCDVVVITAGSPRLPGMSRDDLLIKNAQIMKDVMHVIKVSSPNAVIIPVSNPLDAMVYVALKETGWDRSRVIGMAGILDSARMAHFVYEKLGYGAGQIRCSVMGGHGDDMVPLPRFSTVAGVPLTDLLTWDEINEIVEKTKKGGAEIVGLLKDGSAYYAPAKATALMVEAVLTDMKQIYPCAVMLDGEYGYSDVVSGVPVMIGARGVEKVIEANLNDDQDRKFAKSVGSVKELIDALYANNFYAE